VRSRVFHAHGQLDHELAALGEREQLGEDRIVERVAVVVGMEPDAGHAVLFVATAEVFLPVGQRGIDRAERDQQPRAVSLALLGQPGVDAFDVAVQKPVEAAGPGLRDAAGLELFDQAGRFVAGEPAERPAGEVDVDVDHGLIPLRARMGWSMRRMFPERMSRLAWSGISAP